MGKKYNIIVADPPWTFKTYSDKGKGKSPEQHYQCMTLEDIQNLKVKDIADKKNCMLFMWVTFPLLKQGIATMEAWGFEYKTIGFNWVKKNPPAKPGKTKKINPNNPNDLFWGCGYWVRSNSEICLIGTIGKPKKISSSIHQIILAPREAHSKKPEIVMQNAVKLLGDLPRIELFARRKTEGWDCLGNEIDGKDIRDSIDELINEIPVEESISPE